MKKLLHLLGIFVLTIVGVFIFYNPNLHILVKVLITIYSLIISTILMKLMFRQIHE